MKFKPLSKKKIGKFQIVDGNFKPCSKQGHTPTPWNLNEYGMIQGAKQKKWEQIKVNGFSLCSDEIGKANASFIVHACNRDHVFEELLSACKRAKLLLGMIPTHSKAYAPETIDMLDQAITNATKE